MIPIVNWNEDAREFPGESATFATPDSVAIRDRIRTGLGASSVEFLGSGFNNAHHVAQTPRGDIVIRRALAPVQALGLRLSREYEVLRWLEGASYAHAPRALRQLPAEVIDGCPGYLMSFVQGVTWAATTDHAIQLGVAAGALHRLRMDNVPRVCGASLHPVEIVRRLTSRLESNFKVVKANMNTGCASKVQSILQRVPGRLETIDWSGASHAIVHGDLGDHNVRFVGDLAVLIDWEFAAIGDPLFDLMWFAARDGVWEEHMPAFLDGYADARMRWRRKHLVLLRSIALAELALWAQSGLDDLQAGINSHFFRPGDRVFLERQVQRIDEAEA